MSKKQLTATLIVLFTVLASFAAINFRPVQSIPVANLIIDPNSQSVEPGATFYVDVRIENLDPVNFPLDAFDILVLYNYTFMNAISATQGPLVPPGDAFAFFVGIPGEVWLQTMPPNGIVSPDLGGVAATIQFKCLEVAAGSPIDFDSGSQLWHPAGPIPWEPIPGIVDQEYPTAHTYIDPPTYTVPICVPFTVDVDVRGVSNLAEYEMTLSYDTACVDCIDIVDACFLYAPKWQVFKAIDDGLGLINFHYQSGADPGVYGDGTLARITFHCTGAGESILNIDEMLLWDPQGTQIPTTTAGGRVIQIPYWEPLKLQHLVEWPGVFTYWDIPFPWPPATADGYIEIMAELEAKGYMFNYTVNPETATAMAVEGSIDGETFSGTVTSLWSHNTLEDGTRACMLSAEMDDGTSMAMGFATNLLPPEQVPEVDPYIIVNAQPYIYIRFYWYAWPDPIYPLGRIVTFPYWWYDSHSHPNWFWGPYWWWRVYTKGYYNGIPYPPVDINWAYWRPWWGWWWHWVYWRHWYWWSSYFPYDP
jgi:hypothetical protein